MNYYEFGQWLRRVFNQGKKQPKNLKEMLDAGLLTREEFLRFKITRQQMDLDKTKKELLKFLKKHKK